AEETDWCRGMREAGWKLVFSPVGQIIHDGGGSVKKLSYQRDVMLTAATVKLHRKHGGVAAAVTAYIILMLFNGSRALFWTMVASFKKSYKERANHFFNVVRAYRACWAD
ncbi:MAG: glycosyltransferase family 2 protein, partial [Kiritimatiellae bacterium]|nr:glycosyltransferase family 2 protein [Kiritimatiellia bacterium]